MATTGTQQRFDADDVVAGILVNMPSQFSNDPTKIHGCTAELQKTSEYQDLLGLFDFVDYSESPYSPRLARALNRLQEARLLASINPEYENYQLSDKSKAALKEQVVSKRLSGYEGLLASIAERLKDSLGAAS